MFCAGADLKEINAGNGGRSGDAPRWLRRVHLPRAPQAGHRRRRRLGDRRRLRDRPRGRHRGGDDPIGVRPRRGQAQLGRRRRRAVPPAPSGRPGPGAGDDPHGRADAGGARLSARASSPGSSSPEPRSTPLASSPPRSPRPLPSPCGSRAPSCSPCRPRTTTVEADDRLGDGRRALLGRPRRGPQRLHREARSGLEGSLTVGAEITVVWRR